MQITQFGAKCPSHPPNICFESPIIELLHVVFSLHESPVCLIAGPRWKGDLMCSEAAAPNVSSVEFSPVKASHISP